MSDRLLIVVSQEEEARTIKQMSALAEQSWPETIKVISGPQRAVNPIIVAEHINEVAEDWGADEIIVAKDVRLSRKAFDKFDWPARFPSTRLLRRDLWKELDRRGLMWRKNLDRRLSFWDSKKTDVDEWLKQFQALGMHWVGEALLRNLLVIGPSELNAAFEIGTQNLVGRKPVFCCDLDDDPASSSRRVASIITKRYGEVLHVDDAVRAADDMSVIVIFEDALWTGTEFKKMVSRLLSNFEIDKIPSIKIRHSLTTDYGLWAARHFLFYRKFEKIEFITEDPQFFLKVLDASISEKHIREQWNLSPEQFDIWLSQHVDPLAFRESARWDGRATEAMRFCEGIGRQLIDQYTTTNGKKWSPEIRAGFSLGAGRFGCPVTFAHSVPKVCLPVFWLSGTVLLGDRTVEWIPLFFDARKHKKLDGFLACPHRVVRFDC